ncbi:hypothetical protein KM031_22240 (plasmid) [Gemmobacter fulvus]|uniref:AlgX/AlgJ SGNH hydrolase-like domain-containing protein n=1 Tax=Gemmobacter fulvus TaxID=2840474 RepID=A0A975PBT8_9RHOB|nr:hypothetical protein [Gemmobacter fulvus]MBT9248121.1 hypothetical protein [Gemmobacter fulvus]QWK93165.1 hypothetical protein KM031_22240 [Gemmobacter fulvus]
MATRVCRTWCLDEQAQHSLPVIVAPNKESVFPEQVPADFQKASSRLVHQVEAAAKGLVHAMFLEKFILGHAERLSFFNKGDTHWSTLGAWHVANHIFKGLEIPRRIEPISDEVEFHWSVSKIGDLSNKFDPPIGLGGWHAVIRGGRAKCTFNNGITNHGHVSIWEGGDPDGPSILLFGDSFAGALVSYLAHRSRRLVRLHTSSIDKETLFRERPEIVLSVAVERFLRSVPTGMAEFSYKTDLRQKLQALDDAARKDLSADMLQRQPPTNAAYAADILASMPSGQGSTLPA